MPDDDVQPKSGDILANRRTFLAYVRTALALVAGGVALGLLTTDAQMPLRRVAAVLLVVSGAGVAVASYFEWLSTERDIRRAALPRRSLIVPAITGVVVVASVLLLSAAL